jgi:hypothetical protein
MHKVSVTAWSGNSLLTTLDSGIVKEKQLAPRIRSLSLPVLECVSWFLLSFFLTPLFSSVPGLHGTSTGTDTRTVQSSLPKTIDELICFATW